MKYKNRYAVKLMCKVLKISESEYYRWLKNKDKPSKRKLLLAKIKEILSEHPDNANYGYDRVSSMISLIMVRLLTRKLKCKIFDVFRASFTPLKKFYKFFLQNKNSRMETSIKKIEKLFIRLFAALIRLRCSVCYL